MAAQSLEQFQFHTHAIRIIVDETGEPWFLANDVCAVLGYVNPRDAIAKHCRSEGVVKRDTPTESGNQEMTYINEGNLYRLIIKSRKPEAEPFESWVCDEVLPTIRKTGKYEANQLPEPKTQKALPNGLTLEMQDCVKTLVKERVAALPKDKQGAAAVKCWSSIKKKFGKSYKAVEPEHFSSIISLLGRLPLEGELMPKEEPVTNTSLTITLAPLQPGEIMKRWLITHHGDDMVQMWAVKPDTEIKQRDHFIRDLKTDGYLVIKKDEFNIGNFVMEQVPANLLPVLIEKAGIRLKAINLNH